MKKINLLLLFVGLLTSTQAQVGINTTDPQGALHIHTGNAANAINDVVVTTTGNVGIGTDNPSVKLEINTGGTAATPITGLKLADGNHSEAGKVLTSDANGNATWNVPGFSEFKQIKGSSKTVSFGTQHTGPGYVTIYSGTQINLPTEGTYLITLGITIDDSTGTQGKSYFAQVMPTSDPADWASPVNRYQGSFERFASRESRIYFNQVITVAPGQSTNAYLMIAISNPSLPGTLTVSVGEGALPSCPQCTGGSFVRIN